jgi:hypothetical protein
MITRHRKGKGQSQQRIGQPQFLLVVASGTGGKRRAETKERIQVGPR